MITPTFIETIKILDGTVYNLDLHQARMGNTIKCHFGNRIYPQLRELIDIPEKYKRGLVKCRVVYSDTIDSISFQEYSFRHINKLRLVESNTIDYSFKSMDRAYIQQLAECANVDEDILIVRNKQITDTSFSNVVFENSQGLFTPFSYLLGGIKRELLLQQDLIKSKDIEVSNLVEYDRVYLINSMIDINDGISIDISSLISL